MGVRLRQLTMRLQIIRQKTGDAQLDFESDAELMSVEFGRMRAFLEQRSKQKRSNSVFFRVNNQPILGAKGQLLQAGAIPLFSGAALDLTSAELKGEKKFMKPPEAQGTGGILVFGTTEIQSGAYTAHQQSKTEGKLCGRGNFSEQSKWFPWKSCPVNSRKNPYHQ